MDPDIIHYALAAHNKATEAAHDLGVLEDLLERTMGEGKLVRYTTGVLPGCVTLKSGGITEEGGFTHYDLDLLKVIEGFLKEYNAYAAGKDYLFWRVKPSITCIMGDGCNVKGYAIRARLLCTNTPPEGLC